MTVEDFARRVLEDGRALHPDDAALLANEYLRLSRVLSERVDSDTNEAVESVTLGADSVIRP